MAHTDVADHRSMRHAEFDQSSEHLKARWGVGMIAFLLGAVALVLASLYLSQL